MKSALSGRDVVTAGTVLVIAMLMAFWGLWTLSQPSGALQTLARVQLTVQAAEKAKDLRRDLARLPSGAFCESAEPAVLSKIRSVIEADAVKTGVTMSSLHLVLPDTLTQDALTPASLSLEAQGHEEDLRVFLHQLAHQTPIIFANTVDLNSDGQAVYLNLKGRILCSNRLYR